MFSPIDLKYDNIFQNIYNVVPRPIDCKKLVIYTTYFTRVAEYLNRKFSQRFGLELGLNRKRHFQLYGDGQFYWWRKSEYPKKISD